MVIDPFIALESGGSCFEVCELGKYLDMAHPSNLTRLTQALSESVGIDVSHLPRVPESAFKTFGSH